MAAFSFRPRAPSKRQRGWVGLIVLLLALVIVAMLAQTVLKQYGMLPGAGTARSTGVDDRLRNPAIEPAPVDPTMAAPAPANAIERARGVEDTLRQQAQNLDKQVDGASK